jgi:UDP-glucose 4-epimerase
MKILITGGAGFIGSHLVDRLVAAQCGSVTIFDNFSRGKIESLSTNKHAIRIVNGDVLDSERLRDEMAGTEIVFHLAALSTVFGCVNNPEAAFRANVDGTRQVLDIARNSGVRRVIFASSREVYGEPSNLPVLETSAIRPKNMYGLSKAAAEELCFDFMSNGLEVAVLRLSNVYGTRDFARVVPLFIDRAVRGAPLTVFGMDKVLDFVWIGNLVDVLFSSAIAPCPTGPVNIGSGQGTRIWDLARRISALTGSKSTIQLEDQRQPEVENYVADVTAARRLFDLKCPVDPLEYLPIMIRTGQSNLNADEGMCR